MDNAEQSMRIVGRRKIRPIAFHASGKLLAEGSRFNEEMQKLPSGRTTRVPKGVFRFHSLQESNEHWLTCVSNAMANASGREL